MQKRKTYDTRVKYLARKGLLPDLYRRQIHRSLISKWKNEAPDKYVGHELNGNMEELYELMKQVSEDERMQKALRSFYRINATLKNIIGTGREYVKKLSGHKQGVVDTIQRCRNTISIKRAVKLFGIGRTTYRMWAMETYFQCGHSVANLCNNIYPQQLTVKEVHKIHRLLSNEKYLHWPIISLAHYAVKKSMLHIHPNTWYKYARLMKIKRRRHKKIYRNYDVGVRATIPNEKWHADITEIETADGKISYIYLVVDNYSRYILSWRISDKISAAIRLETFVEAIQKCGLKPDDLQKTELIVDGGTENNNKKVETFIEKYPVEKLIALKDILHSNSIVESVNKIIKYDYLFPKRLQNQTHLVNYFRSFVEPDYNAKRPHGSLNGLTPLEAYKMKRVNHEKIRNKMIQAYQERICYNQNNECLGCPFGCKRKQVA